MVLPSHAQQTANGYPTFELNSAVFDDPITLWVSEGQGLDKDKPFSVLVVWGKETFGLAAEMVKSYAEHNRILRTLVVGIDGANSSELGNRFGDFIETSEALLPTTTFLETELLPWLSERYPNHAYRMLAGHRDFALASLLAMMQSPNTFDAFLCFSPPAYRLGDWEEVFRRFLIDNWHWDNELYISIGFGDDGPMSETFALCRLMEAHSIERSIDFKFEVIQQHTNQSLVSQSLANALDHFFEPYRFGILLPYNAPERLRQRKKALIERYGYDPRGFEIPPIPIARALMPTALQQPERLVAQYRWLVSDLASPYLANELELVNLYHFLQQKGPEKAASSIRELLREEWKLRRIPDWQQSEYANNYTDQVDLEKGLVLHIDFEGGAFDRSAYSHSLENDGVTFGEEGGLHIAVFDGESHLTVPFAPSLSFTKSLSFLGSVVCGMEVFHCSVNPWRIKNLEMRPDWVKNRIGKPFHLVGF